MSHHHKLSHSHSHTWDHAIQDSNESRSAFNSVPKSRCPPAKPPRRKLSYPNENTKVSTVESFQLKNKEKPVAISQELRSKLLNAGIPVNGRLYNEALSKSNSSASSKGHSTSGTEGSDYGSLQGDHHHQHQSHPSQYHHHTTLQTPSNSKTTLAGDQIHCCAGDFFCCSTPKPKFVENRQNSTLNSESLWSSANSPNSIYYTPSSTPKSSKLGESNSTGLWNGNKLTYERNNDRNRHKQLNLMTEKILLEKSPTSISRRHNSDPQIALDRRPSRRGIKLKSADRRSHSFMGVGVGPTFSRKKLLGERETKLSSDYILLTEEVKMLRDMCDKLWDQLRQTQLKLELLQNKTSTPRVAPSFSDLLSEVYYAQRDRDKAVQERLQLAMSERQHLLKQIESLKEIIFRKNICKDDSDDDFNEPELLGIDKVLEGLEICNSPSKLEEHREKFLSKIGQVKNTRQSRLSQQLNKAIVQRDSALAKVQSLLEDRERMQWSSANRHASSEELYDGRSKTMKRMEELEEELASLRLCYSLQTCQANNNCSQSSENDSEDICFYALEQSDCSEDANSLKLMLKQESEARLQAEEECKKLERLVNVLRKKLVGSSLGIPV